MLKGLRMAEDRRMVSWVLMAHLQLEAYKANAVLMQMQT